MEIETAWLELLDELAERAPVTRATIKPPSTSPDALERTLGIVLTPAARRWFELHGGVGRSLADQLLPFCFPLGVDESLRSTQMIREIWSDMEPCLTGNTSGDRDVAGTVVGTWLPGYLLIAEDSLGGGLFVDLRPGPLCGCVRQWEKVHADEYETAAQDLGALMSAVVRSLRTGEPVCGWIAKISNGELDWGVAPE